MKAFLKISLFVAATVLLANAAQAQLPGKKKILFLEPTFSLGVGRYNYNGIALSPGFRFQLPVSSSGTITLTARTGFDVIFLKKNYYYTTEEGLHKRTYFSIPINVGPRFYFLKRYHAGLNLGADLGVSALESSAFHFEPSFGYVVPLGRGHFFETGTSFTTSFASGSGYFNFRFAYGFGL